MPWETLDMASLLDDVAARIAEDPVPGSRIAMEYAFEAADDGHEDLDPRVEGHARPFSSFVREVARQALGETVARLAAELRSEPDGRFRIWREMVVDSGYGAVDLAARHLGVCWGWEPEAAEAHHGEGGGRPGRMLAVVEALAGADAVDWRETVALNASAEHTVGDEREIRLAGDAEVEVTALRLRPCGVPPDRGLPVDVSSLEGMLLPAGPDAAARPSPAF